MIISVKTTISMGHRLPNYDGVCSSLHGHNVTITANIDTKEFIDFKQVKRHLKEITDDFDHAMVLYDKDPLYSHLLLAPTPLRLIALSVEPTTENIATYIYNILRSIYVGLLVVAVEETASYTAIANKTNAKVIRTGSHGH